MAFHSVEDVDVLLSHAGYSVRTSDLPILAHRLEHLDSVVSTTTNNCAAAAASPTSSAHLLLHCNPSDMAAWIDCMFGELHAPPPPPPPDLPIAKRPCPPPFIPSSYELIVADGCGDPSSGYDGGEGGSLIFAPVSYCSDDPCSDMLLLDDITSADINASHNDTNKSVAEDPSPGAATSASASASASSSSNVIAAADHESVDTVFSGAFNAAPQQEGATPDSSAAAILMPETVSSSAPAPHPPAPSATASSSSSRCSYGSSPYDAHYLHSPPQSPPYPPAFLQNNVDADMHEPLHSDISGGDVLYLDGSGRAVASQEAGIRLVHMLMACAEAVQAAEMREALAMAAEIVQTARMEGGAMGKVAAYYADALAMRAYGGGCGAVTAADGLTEALYLAFYEACPYLKFAHFTANQAILDAVEGHESVHIIDFNLMQGLQWPALIHALANRPGGAPRLRITGVGLPQADDRDALREVGMRLAELAASLNVNFSFRGVIATKLNDVKPRMLEIEKGEAVAVNAVLQLHRLLGGSDCAMSAAGCNAAIGEFGGGAILEVLESIRLLSPKVVTVAEQEANHNSTSFVDRFVQSLHYYCTMFDSLQACGLAPDSREMVLAGEYLGREIGNIVACEGAERVERHETMAKWRRRMEAAGFRALRLGQKAMAQASLLLTLFSGEGYTVAEAEEGLFLTLAWHSTPLISSCAWRCRG